jgi:hypothetical protein
MICHERKLIYVHIPKKGGNSINRMLGIGWDKHRDLQAYADDCKGRPLAEYFTFAIVRNPWSWLYSDYNYQRHKSRGTKLHLLDAQGRVRSFSDWVEAAFDDPHRYPSGE